MSVTVGILSKPAGTERGSRLRAGRSSVDAPSRLPTLAEIVGSLGADSPCFCCGFPLCPCLAPVAPAQIGSRLLRCMNCGAELALGEGVEVSTMTRTIETEEPARAAA